MHIASTIAGRALRRRSAFSTGFRRQVRTSPLLCSFPLTEHVVCNHIVCACKLPLRNQTAVDRGRKTTTVDEWGLDANLSTPRGPPRPQVSFSPPVRWSTSMMGCSGPASLATCLSLKPPEIRAVYHGFAVGPATHPRGITRRLSPVIDPLFARSRSEPPSTPPRGITRRLSPVIDPLFAMSPKFRQ